MRFGLWLDVDGTDARTALDAQAPLIALVSGLQHFDGVWVGQSGDPKFPSPLVLCAAITERWGLPIGTATTLMPSYHPIKLAEDACVVNSLSGGRFTLGISAGRSDSATRYGLPPTGLTEYFDRYVETLMRALQTHTAAPSTGPGEHAPPPERRPTPRVWIGGHSGRALKRSSMGDGILISSRDTATTIAETVERHIDNTPERTDRKNRDVAVNRFLLVRHQITDVRADIDQTIGQAARRYGLTDTDLDGAEQPILMGTVEDVVRGLIQLHTVGVSHVILRVGSSRTPTRQKLSTLQIFAEEVLPALDLTI